jgi:putative ABC transport system permease protein
MNPNHANGGATEPRWSVREFWAVLGVALEALRRNKMRSGLTALGIIIGVASVIAMIGIGQGSRSAIEAQISSLGTNLLMVYPGIATQSGARIFTGQPTLTEEDAAAAASECPSVASVSPYSRTAAQVVRGDLNWGTSIQGVGVQFPSIRAWNAERGAFFGDSEVRSAAKVCLLGSTVADALFENENPVGQTVRIKNIPFRIIGVLERKGASLMGQDQDDTVLVPYSTVMRLLKGATKIDLFLASAVSSQAVGEAQKEIDALLRQRHHIQGEQDPDFLIRTQEEISEAAGETSRTLSLLLATVASISLLVGGIGIMNIMLVTVRERTREIGLRLAIGAKRRDILIQFLIEALTLSVAGGLIGISLGIGASGLLARRAGWSIVLSPRGIAIAFGFSAAVGVCFGFFPARRASRLNPIQALRYE